jgi:hypothetical protein
VKIRPIFAWFDCWIGFYWDRKERKLYFLPLPMIGLVFDFKRKAGQICPKCKILIIDPHEDHDPRIPFIRCLCPEPDCRND